MKPILVFHAELENDSSPYGRLELWNCDDWPKMRAVERYMALSGLPGWQLWPDQDQRGKGPIPRMDKAAIDCYSVATQPHYVSAEQQPGIDGNFYEIFPSYVENGRGLFGIHFDANVQGTAGCIGIKNPEPWEDFQRRMEVYAGLGVEQIPLMIGYS